MGRILGTELKLDLHQFPHLELIQREFEGVGICERSDRG